MTTLRELAQAVVDASDAYNAAATHEIMREAMRQQDAAGDALDHATSRLTSYQRARAILAAIDAERAPTRAARGDSTALRRGRRRVMDLDALEMCARAAADATARVHAATHARERYDANEAARAAWEDLGDCGEDVLALIARVRAAEAERDRLRDRLDDVESNEITRALAEQVHGAESGER